MVLNKKNIVLSFAGLIMIGVFIVYLTSTSESRYNQSPDISSKYIGSDDIHFGAKHVYQSLEEIMRASDLVVAGTVLDEGVTKTKKFPLDSALDQKNQENQRKAPRYSIAQTKIDIEEVWSGETNKETILFNQIGIAGDDKMQTKVKKGQQVVLFLVENDDGTYASMGFEDGVFIVKNNKLKSLSKNLVVAKYDEIDVHTLKEDVENFQ